MPRTYDPRQIVTAPARLPAGQACLVDGFQRAGFVFADSDCTLEDYNHGLNGLATDCSSDVWLSVQKIAQGRFGMQSEATSRV